METSEEPTKTKPGPARVSWGSQIEFILTCIGFAVGLGNVWRFPYLCFKNGGGAFLIPYFICLVLIGIPFYYLEMCLGQYCSLGPIKVWRINPWFKGLGMGMVTISSIITVYYAVIIAYCAYYFFASMNVEVPWMYCDRSWSTCYCRDGKQNDSLADPWNGTRVECLNVTYAENSTKTASEEYFNNKALEITSGIGETGGIKWDMTLCNLFVWVVTLLVLSKGIKSLGKVVYFTALFPYFLLTALLVRGITLEGSMDGIRYYLNPDFSRLLEAEVWSDAAVQIFYSLGTCVGGLIAMSSYSDFQNNSLRDTFLIPIVNCFTSVYAGFVIFSVLGFMAHKKGTSVADVATGGPGLAFVVYPEALAQMPIAPLWSVLFFLMMMILGFSSNFSQAETTITGIYDEVVDFMNKDTKRLYIFRISICFVFFLLGLPMTTRGGLYMLYLVDDYLGGFPLLIMSILEVLVCTYLYGSGYESEEVKTYPKRFFKGFYHFKANIETMMGTSTTQDICSYYFGVTWCFIAPVVMLVSVTILGTSTAQDICSYHFGVTWCFIAPVVMLIVTIFKAWQYAPLTMDGYNYPPWADGLGWLINIFCLIFIPAWMIYYFLTKDISRQCRPKNNWGPSPIAKQEWSFFVHPLKRVRTQLELVGDRRVPESTPETNGQSHDLEVKAETSHVESSV